MQLSPSDLDDLRRAKSLLENPGMAARLTSLLGMPIEQSMAFLPERWAGVVQKTTMAALSSAMRFAILTMGKKRNPKAAAGIHKFIVSAAGGAGGAIGLPGLAIELPVSTMVILRSIADIARSEGEDITDPEVRLACLEVFAFGGHSGRDDAAETGYFAVRTALAQAVSEAAKHLAEKGISQRGAPALVKLISQVAVRFNIAVSEKAVAQAVPIVGAASGVAINAVFIDHFQRMAQGHFIVRRLERKYGAVSVKAAYDGL